MLNKKLTDTLVRLIKDDIKRKGLIDSGRLLNSVSVSLNKIAGGYGLDISAEDYFQYVDNRYNILNDVLDTAQWKNTLDEVMIELIEDSIQ